MTYRVVYNGIDVEENTLNGAIEYAKTLIVNDVGEMATWTVDHDELINDWFVQGVPEGSTVAYTATVVGPESVGPVEESRVTDNYGPADEPGGDERLRAKSFSGVTPAEVFGKAAAWLAGSPAPVGVADVGWHYLPDNPEPLDLTVYYYVR